ncbi:MAG TPA: LysR family transcriptional regulator [Thermoleophilia bacterium]|nr:LysR family transcriptional regulator [Actinomycetota bacterium]HQJ26347.1 LysR family transcriptional regulator [Thermoleophilia bacterium]
MDIRQIRLFCRIVERKSFSLAADEMRITQPAASQQVRSLERELEAVLLDRSRRTVVPTDAGQVLYRYGREILDLDERIHTEILDLGELVAGRVLVGASTGPGDNVLPAMLTRFKREYPGVSISLHVDDTHTVIERVLSREFEIGAVGAVTPRPELVAEPLARDEIVLVCAPGHPWAARPTVTLEELVAEPHLMQQQGAGVRSVVEEHLRRAGVRPERLNIVMEMGLMESAKQAAIAGGGVTFLSRWAIGPDLEHGTLSVVSVEGFRILRDFYTVRSRTRVLSRAAEALLAYFREQYAEAAPAGPSATIGHASRHATRGPRKGDRCSSS